MAVAVARCVVSRPVAVAVAVARSELVVAARERRLEDVGGVVQSGSSARRQCLDYYQACSSIAQSVVGRVKCSA
jgi:hypothetical protein